MVSLYSFILFFSFFFLFPSVFTGDPGHLVIDTRGMSIRSFTFVVTVCGSYELAYEKVKQRYRQIEFQLLVATTTKLKGRVEEEVNREGRGRRGSSVV